MDKLSYALGLSMGHNFLGSGIKSLNVEDFAKGVEAVYKQEKPEISFDEAKKIINEFFSNLQDEIAETNKQAGKEFLAENAKRSGVVVLPSGLQYEVLAEGKGRKPKATDKVQCHYHGTLIDGQVFDSSIQRGTPAVFGVNQVIPGWVEALQLMPEGSRWKLYIPSDLAYGEQGAGGSIPANATLIFEVELINIIIIYPINNEKDYFILCGTRRFDGNVFLRKQGRY